MQRFKPGIIDYDGPMATHYTKGRTLSPQAADAWRLTIRPFIPQSTRLTILDLGSGTGRFADFLSESFGARVIGVEPSEGMRSIAIHESRGNVGFVAGTAENIPLADRSCDAVWISQVWHHVKDQRACATELRRVLRDDGVVFIRGAFASSADGFPTLLRFFPGIIQIFEDLPTIEKTIAVFGEQGFALELQRRVAQQIAGNLRQFADRTRLRADTSLALLPDEEFFACLAELDAAAALEDQATPVVEQVDLLVLRAAGPDE